MIYCTSIIDLCDIINKLDKRGYIEEEYININNININFTIGYKYYETNKVDYLIIDTLNKKYINYID